MADPNPSTAAAVTGETLESSGTWIDIAAASPLFAYEPQRNAPAGWNQETSGGSSCSGGGQYAVGIDGIYCESAPAQRYLLRGLTSFSHRSNFHLDSKSRLRGFGGYRRATPIRPGILRWSHPQCPSRRPRYPTRSFRVQCLSIHSIIINCEVSQQFPVPRRQDKYSCQPFGVSIRDEIRSY